MAKSTLNPGALVASARRGWLLGPALVMLVSGCFAELDMVGVDDTETGSGSDGPKVEVGETDDPPQTDDTTTGEPGSDEDTIGQAEGESGSSGTTSTDDTGSDDMAEDSTDTSGSFEPMVWFELYEQMCTETMRRQGVSTGVGLAEYGCDWDTPFYPQIGIAATFDTLGGNASNVVTVAMPNATNSEAFFETTSALQLAAAAAPTLHFVLDCAQGDVGSFSWAIWQTEDNGDLSILVNDVHECGAFPTVVDQELLAEDTHGFGIQLNAASPSMPTVVLIDPVIADNGP